MSDKLLNTINKNNICAIDKNNSNNICLPNNIITKIHNNIIHTNSYNTDNHQIINELTNVFQCKNDINKEICILNKATEKNIITENENNTIKFHNFKPFANIDPITWLSNTNLDLFQEQLFKKYSNYYYSFVHMIDLIMISHSDSNLINHPIKPITQINFINELNNIDYSNKISINNRLFKSYGIIVNTDPSTKNGQHWFPIYINFNSAGTLYDPYTIEYFNSSGQPIKNNQFKQFFIDLAFNISNQLQKCCHFIQVTNIQHQGLDPIIGEESGNCGVYSIYYIWSRLEGVPYTYFNKKQRIITDELITKIRESIFRTIE